jgi:hypothetical protein
MQRQVLRCISQLDRMHLIGSGSRGVENALIVDEKPAAGQTQVPPELSHIFENARSIDEK